MFAVTFALPQESRDFIRRLHHPTRLTKGRFPVVLGNLPPCEILVVHTGIGPDSTGTAMHRNIKVET